MYRYHEGKVEELAGEVTEDNYFVFESDRFSTYVLAYEDKVEQQPEQDNNEEMVTPPVADEDNSGKGEAEQQPEQDNNEEILTPPTVDEDNSGKGEAEQQPEQDNNEEMVTPPVVDEDNSGKGEGEQQTEVKPTTPNVPKTGDNIIIYIVLAVVALLGILKVKNTKPRKH